MTEQRQAEAIEWTRAEYAARYRRRDNPYPYLYGDRPSWFQEEMRLPGAGYGVNEPLIVGPLRPPGVRPQRTPLGPIWIVAVLAVLAAAVASYVIYLLFGDRKPSERAAPGPPVASAVVIAVPALAGTPSESAFR
jgi:hypothetical protein